MKNLDWFENLRALKAVSNMSMREISVKSGIPEPTLEKIFSGATKSPGVNTIQSLVHAMGYTLDDIDSGPNKKSPDTAEAVPEEDRISIEESTNLLVALGLIEEGQRLSDDDLAFLRNVISLLDAWFSKGNSK